MKNKAVSTPTLVACDWAGARMLKPLCPHPALRILHPEHPAYGAALLKVTKKINVLPTRWDWKYWLNQMQKRFLHCSPKNLKIKKNKRLWRKKNSIQSTDVHGQVHIFFVCACVITFLCVWAHVSACMCIHFEN